jgi:hypothetical protein
MASGRQVENELDIAKTAEMAIREVVSGITRHLNPNSPDRERQSLLFEEHNYFELMVAYYFKKKPCIFILKSAFSIPIPIPASSFFATSGIASDLANYILQEHAAPGMEADLASIIAIKTVKDAIDYVEGCGLPIRVALIRKPYRKRTYQLMPKKGKVYGEVETESGDIQIYHPEKVKVITKIISTIEQTGKSFRNKKLHKAFQDQSHAILQKTIKEWNEFRKKYPDLAEETGAKIIEAIGAFDILPDEE